MKEDPSPSTADNYREMGSNEEVFLAKGLIVSLGGQSQFAVMGPFLQRYIALLKILAFCNALSSPSSPLC